MVDCFNLTAVLIGTIIAAVCVVNLLKKPSKISLYIYIVFFFIFIVPLFLDVTSSNYVDYKIFTSTTKAVKDTTVNIIYALFVIYFSLIFFDS